MIRVVLPSPLRALAGIEGEVSLQISPPITLSGVLDALEARYPALQGTLRSYTTQRRRPMIRFFANEEDWSHEAPDKPLPATVAKGDEPLLIIGAIAGG